MYFADESLAFFELQWVRWHFLLSGCLTLFESLAYVNIWIRLEVGIDGYTD